MISLLFVVLLIQLAIHLLAAVKTATINGIVWELYNRLPISKSSKETSLAALKSEVVKLNQEMSSTSAQDDFARWAKLRRQHDKKKDEYDKNAREIQDFKASFDRATGIARWIATTGIRYALQWWFGKRAMFWLPAGWVPHPVEWILSFPSAPLGSISVNMWWIACASVISIISEVAVTAWTMRAGQTVQGGDLKTKEQPLRAQPVGASEKKEL